jgi:glycosyltransferase involved in cell wall biosynthesis
VTFAAPLEPDFTAEIAPGLREIRIARSAANETAEQAYSAAVGLTALTDVAVPSLAPLSPRYCDALKLSALESFAVVASHPYALNELRRAAPGKPLWYEAHNVEYAMKQPLLEDRGPVAAQLLADLARTEGACWHEADLVFACLERDLDQLQALYGPTRVRRAIVPNGVALDETTFTDFAARQRRKQALGIGGRRTALFMGSWHPPNIESVRHILDYARALPEVAFLIMGSVGLALEDEPLPENVRLLGEVDVPTRQAMLATADIALNPTFSGSGTNVKMLDYFGAGIPVVSTRFGARGIEATDGVHAVLTDGEDFANGLWTALAMSDEAAARMVVNARRLVEERYSWETIAERLNEVIVERWPG